MADETSLGIRTARANFGVVLDRVAAGESVVICRRSRPLAALISVDELERFRELVRRDEALAAVFRARGHILDPWTTSSILEVVVTHLVGPSRSERDDPALEALSAPGEGPWS